MKYPILYQLHQYMIWFIGIIALGIMFTLHDFFGLALPRYFNWVVEMFLLSLFAWILLTLWILESRQNVRD